MTCWRPRTSVRTPQGGPRTQHTPPHPPLDRALAIAPPLSSSRRLADAPVRGRSSAAADDGGALANGSPARRPRPPAPLPAVHRDVSPRRPRLLFPSPVIVVYIDRPRPYDDGILSPCLRAPRGCSCPRPKQRGDSSPSPPLAPLPAVKRDVSPRRPRLLFPRTTTTSSPTFPLALAPHRRLPPTKRRAPRLLPPWFRRKAPPVFPKRRQDHRNTARRMCRGPALASGARRPSPVSASGDPYAAARRAAAVRPIAPLR